METDTKNPESVSEASRRIESLARPKPVPPGFLEDRRSVYWVDKRPPQPQGSGDEGGSQVTIFTTTTRLDELAKHRALHAQFRHHRASSMWPVKRASMSATSSERVVQLGQHKPLHKDFKMIRSSFPYVSPAARRASASERIQTLATPKKREDIHADYESQWGQPSYVSEAARKATPLDRTESLAQSKPYHRDFKEHKPTKWAVTFDALKAIASLRLQQLARPRSRTMVKDDYDPYKVSTAAKKTRPTPRLDELSEPIPRKIRQKKAVAQAS